MSEILEGLILVIKNLNNIKLIGKINEMISIISLPHPSCPKMELKIMEKKTEIKESINEVYEIINNLSKTFENQQKTIEQLKHTITEQNQRINNLEEKIKY